MGARRQEFRDHHLEQNDNLFKNRPITIAHDRHKAALPPAQLPKLPKENLRDNLCAHRSICFVPGNPMGSDLAIL
jgi:hypothetical protein